MTNISVVKRDGTREPFDANKINLALVKASEGLEDQVAKVVEVASQLQLTLFDGITSEQLDEAVIQTALQNVKDDPDYDKIAARLLLKNLYKNTLGDYETKEELKEFQINVKLAFNNEKFSEQVKSHIQKVDLRK